MKTEQRVSHVQLVNSVSTRLHREMTNLGSLKVDANQNPHLPKMDMFLCSHGVLVQLRGAQPKQSVVEEFIVPFQNIRSLHLAEDAVEKEEKGTQTPKK